MCVSMSVSRCSCVCMSVCTSVVRLCVCSLYPELFCTSGRRTHFLYVRTAQCISHWPHMSGKGHMPMIMPADNACPQEGGSHQSNGSWSWRGPSRETCLPDTSPPHWCSHPLPPGSCQGRGEDKGTGCSSSVGSSPGTSFHMLTLHTQFSLWASVSSWEIK